MDRVIYLVNGKWKFDSLAKATILAEEIFHKTGVVVSVETKTVKKRK